MQVTYYGHSCFSVKVGGKSLLFDPFIRPNQLAAHVDVPKLKPDYILISHGHWDHVADVLEIAKTSGAELVCNFEIGNWFASQGLKNITQMNAGGKKIYDWGTVKITSAIHSSSLPDNSYGGIAGGFIIESPEGNFYYSGDSALTMDMQLIGKYHKIDFAVLPIGDNFTMDIDDSIACAHMIKCSNIIGVHYDTFPAIEIDKKMAVVKYKEAGKELTLITIGNAVEMSVRADYPGGHTHSKNLVH